MIYFILHKETGCIKIGSTDAMNARLNGLRSDYGDFDVLGVMTGDLSVERHLQCVFAQLKAEIGREFFRDAPELRDYIRYNTTQELPAKAEYHIRTSPDVDRMLKLLAGELQAKTGVKTSMNDAVRYLLQHYRPDLVEADRREKGAV